MRKTSIQCFGLGFFSPKAYLSKYCAPLIYSPLPLALGYATFSATNPTAVIPPSIESMPKKPKSYKLLSGSYQIPHPDKVYTGGEDAFFIFGDSATGVADGVGGWAEVGVDSSVYSNALMKHTKEFFSSSRIQSSEDPATDSLQHGFEQCTSITGSSTGIVAVLIEDKVKICNVGDSRGVLLRSEGSVFKVQAATTEQTYSFNFPYQLGTGSESTPKKHGQKYEWPLQEGDVLILGSDGLFDNLWNEDIAGLVSGADKSADVSKLAQLISIKASEVAEDTRTTKTPWAVGARLAGRRGAPWIGGKTDDITVVVSKVIGSGLESKL